MRGKVLVLLKRLEGRPFTTLHQLVLPEGEGAHGVPGHSRRERALSAKWRREVENVQWDENGSEKP